MIPFHRKPASYHLLADSYTQLLGCPLVPRAMPVDEATEWLYESAPFAVLAHNTDPDALFIYGNKAAQRRFGYSWDEITRLPSRLSAEVPNREERQRFLARVQRLGYEAGYKGVRVAKSGQRFIIEEATLWQLLGADGKLHGQAVVIPRNEYGLCLKPTDCHRRNSAERAGSRGRPQERGFEVRH
jgi:PAS domain-containing protein